MSASRFSIEMSAVLRHGLHRPELHGYVSSDGYIHASNLLRALHKPVTLPNLYDIADIIDREHSGAKGTKRRFECRGVDHTSVKMRERITTLLSARTDVSGEELASLDFFVRAAQGHSTTAVAADGEPLPRIETMEVVGDDVMNEWQRTGFSVVHGTYIEHLDSILADGLRPGSRHRVHFALVRPGEPIISGMRFNCTVRLHVNYSMPAVRAAGVWISSNLVVGFPYVPTAAFCRVEVLCEDGTWAEWSQPSTEGSSGAAGEALTSLPSSEGVAASVRSWIASLSPPAVTRSKGRRPDAAH